MLLPLPFPFPFLPLPLLTLPIIPLYRSKDAFQKTLRDNQDNKDLHRTDTEIDIESVDVVFEAAEIPDGFEGFWYLHFC